ncbi:FAM210A-like [Lucilia cuprina]|nr:FAM210A-like [Lucilia cuprina]
MNTLKLLTNALKINNAIVIRNSNQLKRAANYSTAVFIRNIGSPTQAATIYSNKDSFKTHSLLWPQLQNHACAPIYNTRCQFGTKNAPDRANKSDTKSAAITDVDLFGEASKLGLFAKFKLMYKKYWYVLIPVHVVTSAGWMCGFYYLSKSGVDVPSLLQYIHLSETIIEKVQNSNLGHWAVAYLCYKVATPVRYAVTLGGTTVSIKYLVQQGHIKPIPTKEEFVRMYEEQKAHRAAVKANAEKEQQQQQQQQDQKNK